MVGASAPPSPLAAQTRYFTNVAAQAAGRFATMLSTALIWVLAARWLGAEHFGVFAYAMAYAAVVGAFADAGTTAVLARDLAARRADASVSGYFGNFILVRGTLAVAAAIVGGIVVLQLGSGDTTLLLVASVVGPIGAARFFDPVFQVFDRPWRAAVVSGTTSLFQLAASLAAFACFRQPVLPLVAAYGLAGLAYNVLGLTLCREVLRPRLALDLRVLRAILTLALPVGVASITMAINGRVGTFFLASLRSPEAVAEFAAAAKLVELGAVVAVTLITPLLPILAAVAGQRDVLRRTSIRIIELLPAVALPTAILGCHLAPDLLGVLYGSGYAGATIVLRILIWQLLLFPFSLVTSMILLACGIVRQGYWNGALATLVNIALNLLLLPTLGARGSAVAAVATEASTLAVAAWYVFRTLGNVVPVRGTAKILLFNAVLGGLILFPIVHNPWASDALAASIYVALLLGSGILPRDYVTGWFARRPRTPGFAPLGEVDTPRRDR